MQGSLNSTQAIRGSPKNIEKANHLLELLSPYFSKELESYRNCQQEISHQKSIIASCAAQVKILEEQSEKIRSDFSQQKIPLLLQLIEQNAPNDEVIQICKRLLSLEINRDLSIEKLNIYEDIENTT